MLHPNWLIMNLASIEMLFADLHTATLKSIARHVADALRATGKIMPSTVTQIKIAQSTGLPLNSIQHYVSLMNMEISKEVNAVRTISRQAVRELFEDAGAESISYDNQIYREAGLPKVLIESSPTMQRILQAGIQKQIGSINRLTGVFTAAAHHKMNDVLDSIYRHENVAYMRTVTGVESYTVALKDAMTDLAKDGIKTYSYESGYAISVDAAVLRDLRTGISQTAGEITKHGIIQNGVSYVECSAHQGARNTGEGFKNHESWQGRQFYWKEVATEPNTHNLPDFVESTGLGNVAGLRGANCRHSESPFYPNISTPRWTPEKLKEYADKTYTFTGADGEQKEVNAYEASQIQRNYERNIRHCKRKIEVYKAAGLEVPQRDRDNLKAANKRLNTFLSDTGLRKQQFRLEIAK